MECRACPFECGVDRSQDQGVCRAGDALEISIAQLHYWEEPPISGRQGSGTVFFSHCNLSCRFCQNYDISQLGHGHPITQEQLLTTMLELEDRGAHNVNLVTPTHYTEQLIPVLERAQSRLGIPIVWNSNAYEKAETIARLEGLVQVYLPDLKYHSDELARQCSSAPNYFSHATKAIAEMARQVGPNQYSRGVIRSGLIIRHLVLPGHTDDSKLVLDWIAANLGTSAHVSLMAQYHPCHRARELPGMDRTLTQSEYSEVKRHFVGLGFSTGFTQDLASASGEYTPDFRP